MTWWRDAMRAGKALRVPGVTETDLAALLDDGDPESPIVVGFQPPTPVTSSRSVVELITGQLQDAVMHLYPTWLPRSDDADLRAEHSSLGVAAAEALARRMSRHTDAYGPFVVDLARASASDSEPQSGYSAEIRLSGLTDLLRRSYGRDDIIIAVTAGDEADVTVIGAAAEWLAHAGRLTVWLVGHEFDRLTRIPHVDPRRGRTPAAPAARASSGATLATITLTPIGGRPAANSPAEQHLERALAQEQWASERVWNRGVDGLDVLAQTIRVDLQWRHERIAIELDGDDHRAPQKYAADRLRDNALQLAGYLVLRYPNERVLDDVGTVVSELREVVATRLRSGPERTGQ